MDKKGEFIAIRPEMVIEARFSLTAKQNDILDMVLTMLEDDEKFDYILDISRYKKLYNTDTSNIYRDFERAVESFEGKGFHISNTGSKERVYFPWFSKIHYKPNQGKVVVRVDYDVKKMFLEVKKRIYYHIKYTLNFGCMYSKRIYYYLKSFEDTGWRIDNIDTLRDKLQCPKSYNKYSLFKQFVLTPAYGEINGNSDISFDYEEIKSGKKVAALKFLIKSNRFESAPVLGEPDEDVEVVQNIFSENITPLEVRKLLDVSNGNIDLIREKYSIARKQSKINNIVAWMITAIKENYCISEVKVANSTFNNFKQRTYDIPNLEKQLLGWDDKVSSE